MRNPTTRRYKALLLIKVTLAFAWAIPWVVASFILLATIVFIVPGLIALAIGCWPFERTMKTTLRERHEWAWRDQPLESDVKEPWVK